ncbi:MAG TPA: branched-chain amino acid ABC transporter substrate-binding protein [Solirubrobacteraceae bacterium]|nr:branched-chain amino acid ABC transporter substrate-binding protein [Solirubrobacteraceae bacterium]
MRTRRLCLAALVAGASVAAGCGGTGAGSTTETAGNQLAVYSSLPLQGPSAEISNQIVNGEKLALSQAGGHIGPFRVSYVSLDDANPATGKWSPDATATDAKTAAQDTSTIAYLGDYNSAATALSLPLINAAGILQVSPSSPYVGLTSSLDAGQDEPGRFYPSGRRTFGRLQPGDPGQAIAQVRLMRSLGVHKVYVLDDQDPFQIPLAQLVVAEAQRSGITVAGHDSVATPPGASYAGEVEKVVESGAQAVFVAGASGPGAAALWTQLHGANPRLLLLGPSTMVSESFTSAIGSAGSSTYLTTPVLGPRLYPPSAQRVLAQYRRAFASEAEPYALYGYEAMRTVLAAIRRAGSRGNDRQAVIDNFFATPHPDSVLGPYSIEADGEPTLSSYGVDRVAGGRPVFYRSIPIR